MENDHDGPEDIDEIFKKCKKAGYTSTVDLTASFWQIPLARESRKYTAFQYKGFIYQYRVVPFGTKVSTAALRRASEPVLKGLEDFITDFVDDWMCRSETFTDHLEHLEVLFERILLEGITINFEKVEFCREEIKFLGHIITQKGIKPDPDKVQGIRDFTPPNTLKQLRGFLGLVQFCSRYSVKLSEEISPLVQLTSKDKKWRWGQKNK